MKPIPQRASAMIEVADGLPDSTRIEYAQFLTPDLTNSLHFYTDLLGLVETRSHSNGAALSASKDESPLVLLTEAGPPNSGQPVPPAFSHRDPLSNTKRIGCSLHAAHGHGWQFHGFADHGVSEALYLADADGNGIELYVDRPREQWPYRTASWRW